MLSFKPDTKLERALTRLQGQVVEIFKDLEGMGLEEAAYLNRSAFISNIGASTRIENAVLTDWEIDWVDTTLTQDGKTTAFELKKDLILDKLSKDRERSLEEVVGCRDMLTTIYAQGPELFPLTEATIRGLHHDLLRFYPKAQHYAGQYKTSTNQVISRNQATGEERIVLEPAAPGPITHSAMTDLLSWYNQTLHEYPWPLLTATEFVFRFLAIHPFQDGNGRLGRGLFLLTLLQSDDKYLPTVAKYIAFDRHIEQNRPQYYSVLHQCSQGKFRSDPTKYQLEPLAWFFLKVLKASLADIPIYRARYTNLQKLTETAHQVLRCFKTHPEKRLQVSEIEAATGLPRRTIQRSLKTLSDQGFLQQLGQGAGSRYQLVF